MKREYSGIRKRNLVFYAPLTEGDLSDHVSGNQFVGHSTSIVFDSTRGMYKFYKSGMGGASCEGLNLKMPFETNSFDRVKCTLLFDVILTNDTLSQGYANMFSLGRGYNNTQLSDRFPSVCYNQINPLYTMNMGVLYKIALVLNEGTFKVYVNGNDIHATINADSFDYTTCNERVSLCGGNWRGNDGGGYYRELMVFDTNLTEGEIRDIQNIR